MHNLSDDTSRLAFTWLLTFADAEGRVHGDPLVLHAMLFPRRTDITPEQIETYVQEWADAGLVIWYFAKDDTWIKFVNFEKHQIGLRKDREPESEIPSEDGAEVVRKTSGSYPEDIPLKLSKVNINDKVKLIYPAENENQQEEQNLSSPIGETPTPDPEIQSPKAKPKRDERLDHPAIIAFRFATNTYPSKVIFDLVIKELGPAPDAQKLKHVFEQWCSRGYNKLNAAGFLEWYREGVPVHNGKNRQIGNQLTGMAALQAMINKPEPQGVIIDVEAR
jgi:hypothetical protein